ncbi:MAG: hypothetical protein KJ558_11740 [Gammaproteobacteria bacterium]|nr:hypothetical protein [Gammaproteobacteria bacterium]MBU1655475.1 hypothetical protein [Gammaproteobacteria bacterium]MBU1959671.1 hypothetical protein [Gammaproteobacteria bacterium]
MNKESFDFLSVDAASGITTIDSQPMVFHCNHYNRTLQNTIENCRHIDNEGILIRSAAEVTFLGMREHFRAQPWLTLDERLRYAEQLYSYCGFGLMPLLEAVKKSTGAGEYSLNTFSSHYGRALALNFEKRRVAGEYFDLGFAIGALSAAFDRPFSGLLTREAISLKGNQTSLRLTSGGDAFAYLFGLSSGTEVYGEARGRTSVIPGRTVANNIDEAAVVSGVAQAPLFGNERGLIPAFGVELTRHYADYYNLISIRFEQALTDALRKRPSLTDLLVYDYPALFHYKQYVNLEGMALSRTLLIEAGHICGFNTMGGIMGSEAWDGLVRPMIQNREDWLHGIVAVINALGWGIWRVAELVPNERLVVRVWRSYESMGYLRWFGLADHPVDYLVTGVAASLMNLLYEGDITGHPTLDLDYYYRINRSANAFWGEQIRCMAMGQDFSEVVVTRRRRG